MILSGGYCMANREDIKDNRIVFLCKTTFKEAYTAMCNAIGVDPSKHLREKCEAELALYEASKAK
jgi:hypothetical protein